MLKPPGLGRLDSVVTNAGMRTTDVSGIAEQLGPVVEPKTATRTCPWHETWKDILHCTLRRRSGAPGGHTEQSAGSINVRISVPGVVSPAIPRLPSAVTPRRHDAWAALGAAWTAGDTYGSTAIAIAARIRIRVECLERSGTHESMSLATTRHNRNPGGPDDLTHFLGWTPRPGSAPPPRTPASRSRGVARAAG